MTIILNPKVVCNECGYSDPNPYNYSSVNWIFLTSSETGKDFHFCSEYCLELYNCNNLIDFFNRRVINSNSVEFKKLVYDYGRKADEHE